MTLQVPEEAESHDADVEIKWNKNKSVIDVTYDGGKFEIVKADHSIGRNIDAAWFGLKVKAPTDVKLADLQNATYNMGTGNKFFTANEDSTDKTKTDNRYILLYGSITEEKLNESVKSGNIISYTWTLDWNGDGAVDQTINIKVSTSTLELKNIDKETVWNEKIAEMAETQVKNENPATPAEETTATEESGKDSQPKTGEGIPMALVGMMTLGLAGAYTFKKSNVFRRRQRLCRRNSYC